MKPLLKTGLFVAALLLVAACPKNNTDDTDIFAGAPPMPKGYADMEALKAAHEKGEVKGFDENITVPDTIEVLKNIEYIKNMAPPPPGTPIDMSGRRAGTLDLYVPKGLTAPAPAIVFIHGGGWSGGRKEEYFVYNVDFAKMGYVTASINYRLTKDGVYPLQVQDCKCAIRWMRAHAKDYNVDPNRIAVMGGSAGGHLALMVAYADDPALEGDGGYADQSSRVQAVIDGYGPTDFTEPYARQAPQITGLMGTTYDVAPDLFAKASPLNALTKDDPPTLIIHGTIDKTVPFSHSEMLDRKLTEVGIPHAFIRAEGWPHTADSISGVYEHCRHVIDRFLKLHMK